MRQDDVEKMIKFKPQHCYFYLCVNLLTNLGCFIIYKTEIHNIYFIKKQPTLSDMEGRESQE